MESRAESELAADGEGVFSGCDAVAFADDSAAGFAGGGAGIAGETVTVGAAAGAGDAVGFAADVTETGFSAPSAGVGAIEILARFFVPGAAAEDEIPEAEGGETFE